MRAAPKNQDHRERCLILCRVSSRGQRDRDTIAAQHRELPLLAEARDLRVIGILEDNGISGMIADRPALQQALALAERREYEVLCARDLKRIMRSDDLEAAKVYDKLRKLGIKVLTQHQMFDPSNPNDNFMFSIHRGLSAFDREVLLSNMRSGRKTHVNCAGRIGRDPYGYHWQPSANTKSGGEYVIDKAEAKIVKRLFAAAITTGAAELAYRLNVEHIPTRPMLRNTKDETGEVVKPRVPTLWDHGTVGRLLRSPMYKGERHVKLEGEETIIQAVPAIVSPADWERVQVAVSKRQHTKNTKRGFEYLCRNLVRCGECGYSMTPVHAGEGRRTKSYYRCSCNSNYKKMKRMQPCPQRYIRTDITDAAVWNAVVSVMQQDGGLLLRAIRTIKEQPAKDWAAMVAEVERELASIDHEDDQILRWLKAGHNASKLDAAMSDIQQRRKDASERLDLAQRGRDETAKASNVEAAIRDAASNFAKAAGKARFELRRNLLLALMTRETDRIVLHRDGRIDVYGSVMVLGTARAFAVRVPSSTND